MLKIATKLIIIIGTCKQMTKKETTAIVFFLFWNIWTKVSFLCSVSAVFLNSKSDGRVYAKFEMVLNALKIKYLCFLDNHLVFQKGLFTLQREPSDTPIRLSSLGHKALMEESLGSRGSVRRPSSQNKVDSFALSEGFFDHFGVFRLSKKRNIPCSFLW